MAEIYDSIDSTNPGDWSYDAAEQADQPQYEIVRDAEGRLVSRSLIR